MKVSELRAGQLLVHQHQDFRFYVEQAPASRITIEDGDTIIDKFYVKVAVLRHKDFAWITTRNIKPPCKIAMYLGAEVDNFHVNRIKKHHRLMIDGDIVLFSGYDFRRLKIFQEAGC